MSHLVFSFQVLEGTLPLKKKNCTNEEILKRTLTDVSPFLAFLVRSIDDVIRLGSQKETDNGNQKRYRETLNNINKTSETSEKVTKRFENVAPGSCFQFHAIQVSSIHSRRQKSGSKQSTDFCSGLISDKGKTNLLTMVWRLEK